MSEKTRLKGSAERRSGPYPLGEITDKVAMVPEKQVLEMVGFEGNWIEHVESV